LRAAVKSCAGLLSDKSILPFGQKTKLDWTKVKSRLVKSFELGKTSRQHDDDDDDDDADDDEDETLATATAEIKL
jgi:hypothetical protein